MFVLKFGRGGINLLLMHYHATQAYIYIMKFHDAFNARGLMSWIF